ncbi:MAG: hypothetical protein V3S98_03395 [Dehalococcoidia bacterium]
MLDGLRVYLGTTLGLETWQAAGGGWVKQSGFIEGDVHALAGRRDRTGTVFACAHHDGLYRTTDSGHHWQKVFDGDARSLAIDPQRQDVVYVGTEPVHLYRSDDGGESFNEVDGLQRMSQEVKKNWWFPQEPHEGHVLKIWVDPSDSAALYLCLEHGGVVRTADGGETWQDVSSGIPYLDIHHLAGHPGKEGAFFISTARGFFHADDPAAGWSPADAGMPWAGSAPQNYSHDFVVLPPADGSDEVTLIATGANGSPGVWDRPSHAEGVVLRSTDGAQSWHKLTSGLPSSPPTMAWSLVPHPVDAGTLVVGYGEYPTGAGEMYVTEDRGDSWQRVGESFPAIRSLWLEVA